MAMHLLGVGLFHRLAAEQIAADRVTDGQRIDTLLSRVRNQPLKSAHHRSIGCACLFKAAACTEASLRRLFRATANPSRFNNAPIVLAAGQGTCGCFLRKL